MLMGQSAASILQFVALAVLADVAGVYAYTLGIRGVYPPSHPWSGITLGLLAVGMMLKGRRRDRLSSPQRSLYAFAALILLSASLWTAAAMQGS
jgi:hypothetical protein